MDNLVSFCDTCDIYDDYKCEQQTCLHCGSGNTHLINPLVNLLNIVHSIREYLDEKSDG